MEETRTHDFGLIVIVKQAHRVQMYPVVNGAHRVVGYRAPGRIIHQAPEYNLWEENQLLL